MSKLFEISHGSFAFLFSAPEYYGGDIDLFGGKGRRGGDLNLMTLDDDSAGNDSTGEINIMTGDSEHGDSGEMKLVTGDG